MIYVIGAWIIGLIIGFQIGVRGTRGYYLAMLEDFDDERLNSEIDHKLRYAKAEETEHEK